MATKTVKPKARKKKKPEDVQDEPLLDMSDKAVKGMITKAKKAGYVTYEELNQVLPSDEVSSEKIEDTMAMLSEMGINVVEAEDVEEVAVSKKAKKPARALLLPPRRKQLLPKLARELALASARMTLSACICVKWGRLSCCHARAKSPSPNVSRLGVKR